MDGIPDWVTTCFLWGKGDVVVNDGLVSIARWAEKKFGGGESWELGTMRLAHEELLLVRSAIVDLSRHDAGRQCMGSVKRILWMYSSSMLCLPNQ